MSLRQLIKNKGLTMEEAAKHFGVSRQGLYKIIKNPKADQIEKLAGILKVTPSYILKLCKK